MKKYQPKEFEQKWIEQWEQEQIYQALEPAEKQKKQYILVMFPYPSGAGLHVGHVRVYTGTDIIARYFRMKGYSVLHPMGWDAFGLPAENAAIKAKKNPMDLVPQNIANFKRQMKMVGLSYDWSREFATTDPEYYQWTQWLFIQFFTMGLLYKSDIDVYYCEFCKTGLAEEEVLPNGMHERCGKPISRRSLPQWIFRITAYADRLLEDLNGLDWPSGILDMQKNWIGRKEGINITYKILDFRSQILEPTGKNPTSKTIGKLTCFTTRPDTNFGATFIVLAPEHEFVKKILADKNTTPQYSIPLKKYVDAAASKTDLERIAEGRKKTGVFTGYYAVNDLNGKPLPIWVSDFVLSGFGTGAVVGVPGHDMRDFEFAKEFGIEIVRVVVGNDGDTSAITQKEQVQEEKGTMINSDFLNGLDIHDAIPKIMDFLEEKGWGKRVVSYHLRDWIFSRQRYWGEPIPMIFCQSCADKKISWWNTKEIRKYDHNISKVTKEVQESLYGWFPIDEKNLPLELPYVKSYEPSETGDSPLAQIDSFVQTTCPQCSGPARRETDTMPNWAGSCWYFIRFAQTQSSELRTQNKKPPSIENWKLKIKNSRSSWLPTDWYIGGAEHAVLHLLYSRFWIKAMYDLKLVDFTEPFIRLRNVGIVLAIDRRKMSKSFGNVINPDDVVAEFGADAMRIYEMFMAPFNQEISWSTTALQGAYRFVSRVWKLVMSYESGVMRSAYNPEPRTQNPELIEDKKLVQKLHKTIQKVSNDIQAVKFNTAIAAMMEFVNEWEKRGNLSKENVKKFLQILAPFAPFITEELWRDVLGEKTSIHLSQWPAVDASLLQEAEVSIPVQVNGKVRSVVVVPADQVDEVTVVQKAKEDEKVQRYLASKDYQAIYVKGKILNFVLRD